MKKSKTRGVAAQPIRNSRWLAYAAAGAATALAGTSTAEGAIHYSGKINVIFPPHPDKQATFPLDRPGDSLVFEHLNTVLNAPFNHFAGVKAIGRLGASLRGPSTESYGWVSNLKPGSFVSQGHFKWGYRYFSNFGALAVFAGGYFKDRGIGYMGFAFDGGKGKQYGWARVFMDGVSRRDAFGLVDYAYADPGEPIQVGQTSEEPSDAMGSLGLLAAGAMGLIVWRQHRSKISTPG